MYSQNLSITNVNNSICLGLDKRSRLDGRFFSLTSFGQKTSMLQREQRAYTNLPEGQEWLESPRQKILSGKAVKNSKEPVWPGNFSPTKPDKIFIPDFIAVNPKICTTSLIYHLSHAMKSFAFYQLYSFDNCPFGLKMDVTIVYQISKNLINCHQNSLFK